MFGRAILGLTLAFAAFAAMAEQGYVNIEQRLTAEQLRATGLNTLSSAQLELLNTLLRGESAEAAKAAEATTAAAVATATTTATAAAASTAKAAEPGHDSFIGLDVARVTTRLKGSVSGWEPGTEFKLENGQTWKVLKGSMKLRKPLQAPEVVLVPGVMGRWFLQIDEDAPKARVYRID